jgi:hypothetical protein
MNAAGYNHEWNSSMHPIRVEIRHYLDSILPENYKNEIRRFYEKAGGGDFYRYGVYAINSQYPPDFKFLCDTCRDESLAKFAGFDSILSDFYRKAQIDKLWERYYTRLLEINLQYKPYAEIAIRQITSYCHLDSNFFRDQADGNFYYQQIPLMSHFTAFFNESGNDYWVISGPSPGEAGPGAFYHEPLHKIVNPIVESYGDLNNKLADLVPLSQERLNGDYNTITSLLCESFVRSIDRILSARCNHLSENELHQIIEDEYKLGHILTFYLLEQLPAYEASGKSLEEYYPQLISSVNLEFEKKRWADFWQSQQKK